ncbi:MAG: class I SAM-dependent methyltransferase [Labilithrix sp.]|nr:class I SAM-dependent methyltransferase [Labilithrix sp.]MBX3211208.1 class I SAM-dependent methyltransferase [Labilithrix sp.]
MLRSLLSRPALYQLFGVAIGAPAFRRTFASEYIRSKSDERVLDIGCGPGSMVPYLASAEYVGFDMSPAYIAAAKKQFGARGTFICDRVSTRTLDAPGSYDLVLASAILHHLDDEEARKLFELAALALKPGGRLVTLDCAYVPEQSTLARWIVSMDRGRHVRTPEAYAELARLTFRDVTIDVRHDLLRIPYTHVLLECRDPSTSA